MNIYLYKTIIELIILVIAYLVVTGMDKRITILEEKKKFEGYYKPRVGGVFTQEEEDKWKYHEDGKREPAFADKVRSEEKRLNNASSTQDFLDYKDPGMLAETPTKKKVPKKLVKRVK